MTRTVISVSGMTCNNCVGHVTSELEAIGARNIAVELNSGGISQVAFDASELTSDQAIREAVGEAGYQVL